MINHDGPTPNRQPLILGFTIAFTVLATAGVSMRVWARHLSGANFWWDDGTIIAALLGSYVTTVANLVGACAAFHQQGERNIKAFKGSITASVFINQIYEMISLRNRFFLITVAFTKYSVLFFYWRLFKVHSRSLRIWIISVAVVATGWYVAAQLVVIFQCTPVNFYWNRKIQGGHCINSNLFFVIITAMLPPLDATILALAVPVVWNLQVSRTKQFGIIFVLSVGLFDTIICIYRATIFHEIDPKDITWSDAIVGIWTNAEATVGVFCACLPTLVPLFHFCIGKRESSKSSHNRSPAFGTWSSKAEGFKRVGDPRGGESYLFGNDSTAPIKGDAHELSNIIVTTNIDHRINPVESTEQPRTWDEERSASRRSYSIISVG
ncbi:MAG: hypothetical protein Q9191_002381 [Dirinaria sp. TL-2023a]